MTRQRRLLERPNEPAPESGGLLARTSWEGLLAVAGAIAALAGLVYFLGALTFWLALRTRGYSADIGIEHQPRSQLIGLGLRGVGFVVWVAVLLVIARMVVIRIPGVAKVRFRYTAGMAAVLLIAASFVSWRWLALAIAASTLLIVIAVQCRLPARWHPLYWLALLVPAIFTALLWLGRRPRLRYCCFHRATECPSAGLTS